MPRLQSLILRLYPREWRLRYGDEMQAMLEEQPFTLRMATDLMAGAIDARLKPQTMPAEVSERQEGAKMTSRMFRCAPAGLSREDHVKSAAWTLGGSAVLATIALLLQRSIGPNSYSEALLYAAFPAALMLSNECTYFKPYSRAARMTMALGGAALIVLLMWLCVEIAYRI